jgi:hypothetical protein
VKQETRRQKYRKRWEALKNERSTWEAHWQELADNFAPKTARFGDNWLQG